MSAHSIRSASQRFLYHPTVVQVKNMRYGRPSLLSTLTWDWGREAPFVDIPYFHVLKTPLLSLV